MKNFKQLWQTLLGAYTKSILSHFLIVSILIFLAAVIAYLKIMISQASLQF